MTICKRPNCHASIVWVLTENERRMPLDASPNVEGNVVLSDGLAVVVNDAQRTEALARGRDVFMPHFVTCKNPPPRKPKAKR